MSLTLWFRLRSWRNYCTHVYVSGVSLHACVSMTLCMMLATACNRTAIKISTRASTACSTLVHLDVPALLFNPYKMCLSVGIVVNQNVLRIHGFCNKRWRGNCDHRTIRWVTCWSVPYRVFVIACAGGLMFTPTTVRAITFWTFARRTWTRTTARAVLLLFFTGKIMMRFCECVCVFVCCR